MGRNSVTSDERPVGVFDGWRYWVPWPSFGEARFWLVFGPPGGVATWGLATVDGDEVTGEVFHRPRVVTTATIRDWLEPKVGSEIARALVDSMARGWPQVFDD